MKVEDHF